MTLVHELFDTPSYIIIIWKVQGVPKINKVARPKHTEEEETSPHRNLIITGKEQQTDLLSLPQPR